MYEVLVCDQLWAWVRAELRAVGCMMQCWQGCGPIEGRDFVDMMRVHESDGCVAVVFVDASWLESAPDPAKGVTRSLDCT